MAMPKRPRKPKRKFPNFREFMLHWRIFYGHGRLSHRKFPCPKCHGGGRIIHPDAKGDVNEGFRHAPRIKCPRCGGVGTETEVWYREEYQKYRDEYQEEVRVYRLKVAAYESAVKKIRTAKLTQEELEALGLQPATGS